MERINSDSLVDIIFHLKWKSDVAVHTEGYQASRVNIWRDYFPPTLLESLTGKQAGENIEIKFKSGDILPEFKEQDLKEIKRNQFERKVNGTKVETPRIGRFYPKGLLTGVSGIYRANIQPFRCINLNNGHMTVDLNHPLASKDVILSALVGKVEPKDSERGGTSTDWIDVLTSGPGMQARWRSQATDYFSPQAFEREDSQPDTEFYSKPRLVQHIDDTAIEMVSNTYGRFLKDEMNVLDLMSSWQSHIPEKLKLNRLVGLGLNGEELKKNPQIDEIMIHDLNVDYHLPFESNTFDAAINTVSVEYLTNPLAVFKEVSRVLKPDGHFVVTFSNRWFPTKAIKIWSEIHEFERMGLVLEYFIRSQSFTNFQTYSFRGLPRPYDDKYFPELIFSDPIYAVWGQKK